MIPDISAAPGADIKTGTRPSGTFLLNHDNNTVGGAIDGTRALEQAVFMMLSTKRYEWLIHSWNYGSEILSLIGRDMHYCIPEAERMIRETLLTDDRISEVKDFVFDAQKNRLRVSFTVVSVYGELPAETEVTL